MSSFNKTIIMGNLTRDPELKFTASNMAVANIGVAVNERYKNKQTDEWEERVNFIDCEAWGRTAENINEHFNKGKPILIEGKLRMDQWEDQQGNKRSKLKVVVDRFEFVGGRDDGGQDASRLAAANGGQIEPRGHGSRLADPHQNLDQSDIPF